jgi:hypothetical protein
MTTLTMRLMNNGFVVIGPDVEPMKFISRHGRESGARLTIRDRRSPRSAQRQAQATRARPNVVRNRLAERLLLSGRCLGSGETQSPPLLLRQADQAHRNMRAIYERHH